MRQATLIWSPWQRSLQPFASAFTRPGHRRFVEWAAALVLNLEEHTITQSATAIERLDDWKTLESFAEYAVWRPESLTRILTQRIDEQPGRVWHGYRISVVDDTKVHRSGEHVWGTCTFHEYTVRCPNRATTVRARNWVALGVLLSNDGQPAWYPPVSGPLHSRKSQLPEAQGTLLSRAIPDQVRTGRRTDPVASPDRRGASSGDLRRRLCPEERGPTAGETRGRIDLVEFLTRLRHDARLHALPPTRRPKRRRGRRPRRGRKLSPPRQGGRWPGDWQEGKAFIYGRMRKARWKEVVCLWRV